MIRLNRHRWAVSSLLLYAGVVGCAIVVAGLVTIGLKTNGSQPVPRAANVDRTAPHPISTSTVVPSSPVQTAAPPAIISPPPTSAPTYRPSTPTTLTAPTTVPKAIQPQTVSPNGTVVEVIPGSDVTSPSPSADSSSSSSSDSTTTTTSASGS